MALDALTLEYNRESRKDAARKKKTNIIAYSQLDRSNILYGVCERRLLLFETKQSERLFIQYPGKESIVGNVSKRRPWDFRPKLLKTNGEFLKDLSFKEIWDDLSEIGTTDSTILSILAAVLFKMAVMHEYEETEKECTYEDVKIDTEEVLNKGTIKFSRFEPNYSSDVMDFLNNSIPRIRDVSLEAYLLYNDLLVQNEDCKYYFRDIYVKKRPWDNKIGRYNTLLSHISIIEYLEKKVKLSELLERFQRGQGVGPIPFSRIESVTNGLIKSKTSKEIRGK